MPNIRYREHALKHLRTAPEYRRIYNSFKKAEKDRNEAIEEEKKIIRGIKAKLLSKRFKLKGKARVAEIVAREVYEDIEKVLGGCEPSFLNSLIVEQGKVKSPQYVLVEEGKFDSLRRFISNEEKLEKNVNASKKV